MAVWSRAAELADRTPPSRNRYVDFLRALSMLVVTIGHWLAAAPYVDDTNTMTTSHILTAVPWTAWLTWIVQVMPIFFMVGGYANGISWRAARRDGKSYAAWLKGRLRRLVWPILPLLAAWAAIVAIEHARGVRPELISYGSEVAFIPIWFLAVYIVIVLLVPVMEALWARFRMGSFWALTAAAVLVDVMYFAVGLRWLGFANYLFVWGAVCLLGYAWLDERFERRTLFVGAALSLVAMLLLVSLAPYPVSMIGVPGDPISTTTPPKATLIALAIVQFGLLIALQAPAQRWLAGRTAWTATVAINGTIMTLFIWHLTATTLVVLASEIAGGFGLRLRPGSAGWWWSRLLWIAVNTLALVALAAAFGRFERPPRSTEGAPAPAWRYVLGALFACAGLALLAQQGVGGYGPFGLNVWGLALSLVGIGLVAR